MIVILWPRCFPPAASTGSNLGENRNRVNRHHSRASGDAGFFSNVRFSAASNKSASGRVAMRVRHCVVSAVESPAARKLAHVVSAACARPSRRPSSRLNSARSFAFSDCNRRRSSAHDGSAKLAAAESNNVGNARRSAAARGRGHFLCLAIYEPYAFFESINVAQALR